MAFGRRWRFKWFTEIFPDMEKIFVVELISITWLR
jgi:hypothetical protein